MERIIKVCHSARPTKNRNAWFALLVEHFPTIDNINSLSPLVSVHFRCMVITNKKKKKMFRCIIDVEDEFVLSTIQ